MPGQANKTVPVAAKSTVRKRLAKTMTKALGEYGLLGEGDHVMVAVSGGKDSYTLLDLLAESQRRAPFSFRVTAVHLDQKQPGYDGSPLRQWLESFGAPFEIVSEDTYSTVLEQTVQGKAYCAVCSRMRRGILYTTAERLGCNKIALGHHRDDSIETLLLNLFYGGKLQGMPAGYTTDDGRFDVIRPLILCAEEDIRQHAEQVGYPILPCNLCGAQDGLKREQMKTLLLELEKTNPMVRSVMAGAMQHVHPTHLLDRDVKKAWLEFGERNSSSEATGRRDAPGSSSELVQLRTGRREGNVPLLD